MLRRFLFYGFLGWSLEVLYTGMAALIKGDWRLEGFTYLWMFLIYGMGAFLEKVHDLIRTTPWLVRGAVWLGLIWTIEYSTGWGLKTLLGACPWDYGNSVYSVNGFIRLDMAVEWFCTGLLFERIHDWLDGIMDNVQSRQVRD